MNLLRTIGLILKGNLSTAAPNYRIAMPVSNTISPPILAALLRIEPDAQFFMSDGSRATSVTSNRPYFVKHLVHDPIGVTHGSTFEQYLGEAESLRAMYAASPGICPRLFECSIDQRSNCAVFVSEYKTIGPLDDKSATILGRRLAEMHINGQSPTGQFGFAVPTYCGATRMRNGWYNTWGEAFDNMLADLSDILRLTGRYKELCGLLDEVRARAIPRLLRPLKIQPVLLHGDLWSGNAGTDKESGQPVIFDPSSYYGHNEADLSIARIFGGFPPSFFKTYHEHIPITQPASEYDQRAALYELFHYLNHTVLFGGSYEGPARQKMIQLLQSVNNQNSKG